MFDEDDDVILNNIEGNNINNKFHQDNDEESLASITSAMIDPKKREKKRIIRIYLQKFKTDRQGYLDQLDQ
jgi:hypothetical protein